MASRAGGDGLSASTAPGAGGVQSHGDVLELIGEVERVVGHLGREATDAERLADERAALVGRQLKLASKAAELESRLASAEAARDEARAGLATAAAKIVQVVRAAERHASRAEELRRTLEASSVQPGGPALGDAALAQRVEQRVEELLAPKIAQLATVAAFLRTRRERLAALRQGLRHRARGLRAMRAILRAPPLSAGEPQDFTGQHGPGIDAADALARERAELLELRDLLAASEKAVARRAAGIRGTVAAALTAATLALAAGMSWHLAGAMHSAPVIATVELEATSRSPQPRAGFALAPWVEQSLASEAFRSAVVGRLVSRGRNHAEASALVAANAPRIAVAESSGTISIVLRGEDAASGVALLDAVAITAATEANRAPERRTDLMRVGIANARQEVGRTVFTHVETLADTGRALRAGKWFGALLLFAGAVGGIVWWSARRAGRSTDHEAASPDGL